MTVAAPGGLAAERNGLNDTVGPVDLILAWICVVFVVPQ